MLEKISLKVLTFNIKVLNILLTYKKLIIRAILIISWVILYNNHMLTLDRIKIFIFLIFIILIYKIIYNYFENIYQELRDEGTFYLTRLKYDPYNAWLNKIIYILLFIQKWRNPFLVFLAYTDKKIFYVMRYIYEFLRSYGMKQEKREIINLFIIYILFLGTIKIIFGRLYLIVGKWLTLSFTDVFFNRIYGTLISILVFSDVIYFLRLYIINGILGCLLLYFSVSIIFICIELFYIFEMYPEKTRYFGRFMLTIRNSLYTYITIDLTIYHRMHYTILGRIITIISEIILDLEEDDIRFLPNAVVGSYKSCIRFNKGFYIILKYRYRYTSKYMDNISSHFLTKFNYLESTFITYWEFLKRNYYKGFILIQDRKNYPSAYLFHSLVKSFMVRFGPGMTLTEIYYYKLKCQENHLVLNVKDNKLLLGLYEFDVLRLKIILYMLWDILEIIDFDTKNWIEEYGSEDKDLLKWENWNILWNIFEINKGINGFTFIQIKQEIYKIYRVFHFFKKELKFYDIENNTDYFVNLFDYLGYVKTDYAYEDKDAEYNEMCNRYYISSKLESYSESLLFFWKKFNIDMNFDRKEDILSQSNYEESIEIHFTKLIKDLRTEWVFLKKQETLEERNKRLLCELECLYINISQK